MRFCWLSHVFCLGRFFRKGVPGCEKDSVLWAPGVMMQTYHLCGRTFGTMAILKRGGVHLLCVFPSTLFFILFFISWCKYVCLLTVCACKFKLDLFIKLAAILFLKKLKVENCNRQMFYAITNGHHHIRPMIHSGSSIELTLISSNSRV